MTGDTGAAGSFTDFNIDSDPGLRASMWERWDEVRDEAGAFETQGPVAPVWIFTRYDEVHDGLQDWELFSSANVTPYTEMGQHTWIPEELDPPDHGKYRQLLTPFLTPAAVKAMESGIREQCVSLIEEFKDRGECDFFEEFAKLYPTTIFMRLMGLPVERSETLLQWAHELMHLSDLEDPDGSIRGNATMSIMGLLAELIADRRADPKDDVVTAIVNAEVDGAPITDENLLMMCFLLYMGGLDTVAGELGAFFYHLATNPADRERIVSDPAVIPQATEELLRAFSIVTTGRVVTRDAEFGGCPVKAGDRAVFALAPANRDEAQFEGAAQVDFDRTRNRHMAFGLGPHRCLGSYLARAELIIALEEWHKRIPEYSLDESMEVRFHAGGVAGYESIPLRWPPKQSRTF